jgi:phage host-nuclease inhibitor protein Gam
MSDQARLRRHIAALEDLQRRRIKLEEKRRAEVADLIERRAREIENLKAQLTIGVAT